VTEFRTTPNYKKLLEDVRGKIDRSRFQLIGIEGRMGEGKSCLAKQLAEDLGLHSVSVDDHRLEPVPNLPYLQTLKLPQLAAHLDGYEQDYPTETLIVEAICLREALNAIGRKLDFAIYVKKISKQGLWNTQFDIEDYENDERPNVPKVLYEDEVRYHSAYRPHELADFVFEWTGVRHVGKIFPT
jgi:hypothetical protein